MKISLQMEIRIKEMKTMEKGESERGALFTKKRWKESRTQLSQTFWINFHIL